MREFIEESFRNLGEEVYWKGSGVSETGLLKSSGKEVIGIDPRYFRPTEVDFLQGDYTKAKQLLQWEPETTFKELVRLMVNADFEKIKDRKE